MNKVLALILFCFLSVSSITSTNAQGTQTPQVPPQENLEATVTDVVEEKEIEFMGSQQLYQKIELKVTKGSLKDQTITVENGKLPSPNIQKYQVGEKVMVLSTKDYEGNDLFYITDYIRRDTLAALLILFAVIAITITRWRGITSFIGMAISFAVIFLFILPQIANGNNPIFIAISGSLFIIPVTFYLSHGLNKKTSIAIAGTTIALIITGLLAQFFINAARLTGFASEEAAFLSTVTQGTVDIKGLLLAGIIIGSLGVLDDITVAQAAIVQQLKEAKKQLSFGELYNRAMSVGQDHIASMVNTLVLVYTGASLPLLLLFINNPMPFSEVINNEIIADEIIRTLVSSIGLILAVPITTVLAAFIFEAQKAEKRKSVSPSEPKRYFKVTNPA